MRVQLSACGRSLLLALSLGIGSVAAAQEGQTVDLTIDFAKILRIDQPADTIVIGNPGIADATIEDEDTLVLTGKTAGTTNLIVLGREGDEILNVTLRVSSDIRQLTTVFFGASRQTFSCAPVCEQVISVGDDQTKFENANTQITTRQAFSRGQ